MLNSVAQEGLLTPHKFCSLKIIYLVSVDDLFIFSNTDMASPNIIRDILTEFAYHLALYASLHKSSISVSCSNEL